MLLAIGIKGGLELAKQPRLQVLPQTLWLLLMGVVIPLLVYPVLRFAALPRPDAANLAARGKGDHGEKRGSFDANENIQLELLTPTATAKALATEIMQEFGQDYALVQWLSEVRVLRADKF